MSHRMSVADAYASAKGRKHTSSQSELEIVVHAVVRSGKSLSSREIRDAFSKASRHNKANKSSELACEA